MSGKAAYEAHKSAYDDARHEWADPDDIIEWPTWERLPAFEQEAWEAGAAAGAAPAHERTAELLTEVNELRALVGEIIEIISEASTLTAYDNTGELSALIDRLIQRINLAAPAAEG